MRKFSCLFIVVVFLCSCSGGGVVPGDIIPPKKMEAVLWDYIRADVYTTNFIKKDSSKKPVEENIRLQNKIFSYYHISKEDFYRSYDYYIKHSDLMNSVIDSIIARQKPNEPGLKKIVDYK